MLPLGLGESAGAFGDRRGTNSALMALQLVTTGCGGGFAGS